MNARLIAKPDEEWAKIMDEIDYKIFRGDVSSPHFIPRRSGTVPQ